MKSKKPSKLRRPRNTCSACTLLAAYRRKLQGKVQELTDANEMAFAKIGSLEKTRHKLMQDLDDAQVCIAKCTE